MGSNNALRRLPLPPTTPADHSHAPPISGEYRIALPDDVPRFGVSPAGSVSTSSPIPPLSLVPESWDLDRHGKGGTQVFDLGFGGPDEDPYGEAELDVPATEDPQAAPRIPLVVGSPHEAIATFAGFPSPPTDLFGSPTYAFRVFRRRHVLRRSLALAKMCKKTEVPIYEAALRIPDDRAVARGASLVTASILFAFMLAIAVARLVF